VSVERSHGRSPWREAYELLIQRPERQSAPPESSVSISRNAKGVAQFEVVVRGASPEECQERAFVLYRELVASFPYPVEASVSPQEPAPAEIKPRGRRAA
jgi:hypothetical protein